MNVRGAVRAARGGGGGGGARAAAGAGAPPIYLKIASL
jgi:hypothetical protein